MLSPPVFIALTAILSIIGLTLRVMVPWIVALIVYFGSGRDPKVFAEVAKFRPRPPWQRS